MNRVPQVRPHAHRMNVLWEPECRHHPFGEPSVADRIGAAIVWTLLWVVSVYFLAHLLAATLR
jgi:hypothetical protein